MGAYVNFGIAKSIELVKRYGEISFETFDKLTEYFQGVYIVSRGSHKSIILQIDETLFNTQLIPFVAEQFEKFMPQNKDASWFINARESGNDYNTCINNGLIRTYALYTSTFVHDISYAFEEFKDIDRAYASDFVSFFNEGKAMFESYWNLFNYIRNLTINSTNNPIAKAFFVSVE